MTAWQIAIETTTRQGSVALLEETQTIKQIILPAECRTAESLAPAVAELLALPPRGRRDVALVSAAVGPGSFTGIRIGVTAAKTLAYALGCDVAPCDTLAAIIAQVRAASPDSEQPLVEQPLIDVAINAYRGQVYCRRESWRGELRVPSQAMDREDWLASLAVPAAALGDSSRDDSRGGDSRGGDKMTVAGDAWAGVASPPAHLRLAPASLWPPMAATIGRLGWEMHQRGEAIDPMRLRAAYLRQRGRRKAIGRFPLAHPELPAMIPLPAAPDHPLDVLIVAPHPDDAELGMGGAIAKMRSEGWRVGILDLTSGEPTPHGSLERRRQEAAAASAVLDVSWRHNAGLPNRSLEATLPARALVAGIVRQTRPRWLFAPYWEDAHPDHIAATQIVDAARFWAKLSNTEMPGDPHHPERIYHYYCIHLRTAVQPDFILDISDQWEAKLESIRCYQSQFITGRPTESPTLIDRFRDDAAYWGRLINRRYGEPYAAREPVALESFQSLI